MLFPFNNKLADVHDDGEACANFLLIPLVAQGNHTEVMECRQGVS